MEESVTTVTSMAQDPSISTTYVIKSNSKLERFGQSRNENSFINMANAARDYAGA